MRVPIHLLEPLDAGMRIDLRGPDRRVAEELLYGAQVGSGIQEMRGEGVMQGVGGETGILADEGKHQQHHALNPPGAEASTIPVE